MKEILFLGTNFQQGKGGVASVLKEYKRIFPDARFVSTTKSGGILGNISTLFIGLIQTFYLLTLKKKIKIIHIHGASYHSFYRKFIFFELCRLFNKKIIYHIHGAEFHLFYENSNRFTKKLVQYFINNVDCLICLSQKWKTFFNTTFNPNKIEIIPNIVPEVPVVNRPFVIKKPIKFIFLGHISERKGIWLLLETIKGFASDVKGKVIFQIGGNGEVDQLKKRIKEYEIEELVEYIGWVSDENKEKYLLEADVFILPSYNEGLPISVLEAMAYGIPVIATNVGGIPEVIENRISGILIEPGNAKQLERNILFALNNPLELKKYVERSKEVVKAHYPESVKKELLELYNSL